MALGVYHDMVTKDMTNNLHITLRQGTNLGQGTNFDMYIDQQHVLYYDKAPTSTYILTFNNLQFALI